MIPKNVRNFVYYNNDTSISLFGQEFWQRYSQKRLKFTLKGELKCFDVHFMSTIGIKDEEIEIEVNWTQDDLSKESLIFNEPFVDLSKLFNDCQSLKSIYLDFTALETKELKKLSNMFNN